MAGLMPRNLNNSHLPEKGFPGVSNHERYLNSLERKKDRRKEGRKDRREEGGLGERRGREGQAKLITRTSPSSVLTGAKKAVNRLPGILI